MHRCPRFLLILALLPAAVGMAVAQESRFQQARQFGALDDISQVTPAATVPQALTPSAGGEDASSFGVQEFLKEQERLKMFRAFSQTSILVTSNAALTRTRARSDALLTQTLGLEFRRPLGSGWQVEASLQYSLFRYDRYRPLNFNSLDAEVGLLYHLDKLGGLDFFLRYDYTALTPPSDASPFLQSHTGILGVQKGIAFNPASGMFVGFSAQTSSTDPKSEERSEFAAFGGVQLQATRHLQAVLTYRWALIPYTDSGRTDENQILSAGLHYRFNDWVSAYTNVYADWNWSNRTVFKYSDVKGGGGLGLEWKF